jgi:hypothetical protein
MGWTALAFGLGYAMMVVVEMFHQRCAVHGEAYNIA